MSDDLDLMLDNYDPGIRELSLQARELITRLVPEAGEKVHPGWRTISFSLDGKMSGQVCSIGPHKKYVNLYFMSGISLDDPKGLLEGTGKNMRHVKITDAKELNSAALKALIKAAIKLQKEKLQQ